MDRKPDWPAMVLLTALTFGAVVRFVPAVMNGFPLNDGGMFHAMIRDLKANDYLLPRFATYNSARIPFAYPPLGFYVAASLSDLLHLPELFLLLWLPPLVNTLSILIYYKFARHLLDSRLLASLAVLIYALAPRSFLWQVMGGGITRAFGVFFLLLMAWQAVLLFHGYSHKKLLLTTLCGMGSVLSHPQAALHAALAGVLIFVFYGWNRRGFLSAVLAGLGVALISAPWWGLVLMRHGPAPLLSAGQTSQRNLESYLALLRFEGPGDYLVLPVLLLAIVGVWHSVRNREFFLIAWIVLAYLIDPRGAEGMALLSLSMLAGLGLYQLAARMGPSDGNTAQGIVETPMRVRSVRMLLLSLMIYFVLVAGVFDLQLVNTSLKSPDLEMIEWVKGNIPEGRTFLLATGREYSMSDPLQEWFPALTGQKSITTVQGLEWTLGGRFFPWYEEVIAFQHCADIQCIERWSERNGVDYDYLVVMIPLENDGRALAQSLSSLGLSARSSGSHMLIHETNGALILELRDG